MEIQLLKNAQEFPDDIVLKRALGVKFGLFEKFSEKVSAKDCGISFNWKYYNDAKAWLCKAVYKKKTVFWLSVWEGFFKLSFFFAGRLLENIKKSDISADIKKELENSSKNDKLVAVLMNITDKKQFEDVFKLINLKKELK